MLSLNSYDNLPKQISFYKKLKNLSKRLKTKGLK